MHCHMAETMAESEPARSFCFDSAQLLHRMQWDIPLPSSLALLLACCVLIVSLLDVIGGRLVHNEMLAVPSSNAMDLALNFIMLPSTRCASFKGTRRLAQACCKPRSRRCHELVDLLDLRATTSWL